MAHSANPRGVSPLLPGEKRSQTSPAADVGAPASAVKAKTKTKTATAATAATKSKAGHAASYRSDGVDDHDVFLLPVSDYYVMLVLTLLATAVRVFRIYQPSSVVFDEVHFGGFATKYIKGKFFMDVHPPLAKMLIALTGWLAGFNGSFDFKEIGKDYLKANVPYVAMRMFPAVCGILLAPAVFLTLKTCGCRTMTAAMGAGLVIFENGLLTQARLILLDSPLMAGTAFTALAFTSFTNQHEQGPDKAFKLSWWFWLVMTGLGLGITSSIKWVGFFTVAWVGTLTLIQLWVLLGDTRNVTLRLWTKHFMARVFCLIVIPVTFYLGMFAIHFLCLPNPGDGDGFMSSEFQATLNSKGMKDVPADVVMGSRVSIRHVNTQGGYLHSHPLMYPVGSKQQQITLYPHKDDNNIWLLENRTQPLDSHGEPINGTHAWDSLPEPFFIHDKDVVRIYHRATHRRLHSHDVRPPITEADWQNEVSAYGFEGFDGDANDLFRVEIAKSRSVGPGRDRLRTIQTKFRLVHVMTGCALFSHKVKLPEWASEQQEVTCARGGTLPNSLWYVEGNEHPLLGETVEKVNYARPGFLGKFWELQTVMWKTNAGLVESHAWDSRPDAWPLLRRGINFWSREHRQVYLMGNPLVWWASTAAVALYVAFKAVAVLRWQRGCRDYANPVFKRFDFETGTFVLGWAFHYFPFYLMQRQLFLHHYFPALYFAILAFCQAFDFLTARVSRLGIRDRPIVNKTLAVGLLALSAAVFMLFAPLAYGNTWTKAECKRVKMFGSWDFDCNAFYENYDQYTLTENKKAAANAPTMSGAPPIPAKAAPPQVPKGQPADAGQISGAPVPNEQPSPGQRILSREEKVEYRDQDGNLLDPEQVKALEGKVEFRTKYETRTRVVDADGNEVPMPAGGWPEESPEAAEGHGSDQARPEAVLPAEGGSRDDGGNAKGGEADAEVEAKKQSVAPPHPDVEGVDPETAKRRQALPIEKREETVSVEGEVERKETEPKPASDGNEATP